ncbi:hypothetical protein GQA25_15910 [Escherichia coli]|nr:hypothetical protein [Escherichia coli]
MLPSETMIWQPEFTDKTLSRKPGAVQHCTFHKKIFADYSVACWEKKYKSRLINGLL